MDANGSRYHALVTQGDWTTGATPDGHWDWLPDDTAHTAALGQLVLRPLLFEFKASSAASLPEPTSRAGGAFDAYGNLYSLNAEGTVIRVWSSGSGNITDFWPLPAPPMAAAAPGAFGVCAPAAPAAPLVMDALTVTTGHYLVVASPAAGGLLIFDLHGGGPPLPQPWPDMPVPQALLALDDGGVALFGAGALHRLGPDLRPCVPRVVSPSAFSPQPAPVPPPAEPPCQLVLGPDAMAVAALPAGRFLVLRLQGDGLYLSVIDWAGTETVSVGPLEDLIEDVTASSDGQPQPGVQLSRRTLAVEWPASASDDAFNALVLAASGDQAFRFKSLGEGQFELQREFIPLRGYQAGGLASLATGQVLHRFSKARAFYAAGGRWLPLLTLPRPRCERDGELIGPVWDSATPGCVWHRVALDARRPPGSALTLQSRAADTEDGLKLQPWRDEPELLPHPAGSELAWREPPLGACKEFQTLTCLLQAATGRYLQLRLLARGDGQQSPGLASLRAWYPRFSYLQHYLPAVYRADPTSAEFTERFLSLFEGELTRWEDRIAAAQLLLDARTAPRETLDWLANWLAVTFDGSTGPTRRRALLRHAFKVHARRGTVPGMLLAATLAWEPDTVDAEPWLAEPEALPEREHGVRLQELFGIAPPLAASAWRPAQGRAALLARLDGSEALLGDTARAVKLQQAFGFLPRAAQEEAGLMASWVLDDLPEDEPRPRNAQYDAYLQATQPCAPLRQRWQDYLARRWRRISLLNAAWGTAWRGFDRVPSPLALPAGSVALADWWRFEAQIVRALTPAHRFRVVLPLPTDTAQLDFDELARRRAAVERAVARDKPAHTVAEIRFGFELFRVGEARLGHDTRLEHGLLRRPELAALTAESIWPPLVLGERDLGGGQLTHPRPLPPLDRVGLDR